MKNSGIKKKTNEGIGRNDIIEAVSSDVTKVALLVVRSNRGGSVEISRAWSRAEWTFLHFFARDEPTVPHFPKPFSLVINVYTYDESTRIDRSIEGNKGER